MLVSLTIPSDLLIMPRKKGIAHGNKEYYLAGTHTVFYSSAGLGGHRFTRLSNKPYFAMIKYIYCRKKTPQETYQHAGFR